MYKDELIVAMSVLDFTENEAKLYLALRSNGPISGYAAAQNSGVSRARTYTSLNEMKEKGFIREIAGSPPIYEAVDIETIIATAEDKERKLVETANSQLRLAETEKSLQDGIVPIYGYHECIHALTNQISQAKQQIVLFVVAQEFTLLEKSLKQAIKQGASIHMITTESKENFCIDFPAKVAFYNDPNSIQLQQGNHWIICTIDNTIGALAVMRNEGQSYSTLTTNKQLIRLINDYLSHYFIAQEFYVPDKINPIWGNFDDDILKLYKSML